MGNARRNSFIVRSAPPCGKGSSDVTGDRPAVPAITFPTQICAYSISKTAHFCAKKYQYYSYFLAAQNRETGYWRTHSLKTTQMFSRVCKSQIGQASASNGTLVHSLWERYCRDSLENQAPPSWNRTWGLMRGTTTSYHSSLADLELAKALICESWVDVLKS